MAIRMTADAMSLDIDNSIVAAAWFSEHARPTAHGAWIVSTHPPRLFSRDQAIAALTVAEIGESGYSASHPLVVTLRK